MPLYLKKTKRELLLVKGYPEGASICPIYLLMASSLSPFEYLGEVDRFSDTIKRGILDKLEYYRIYGYLVHSHIPSGGGSGCIKLHTIAKPSKHTTHINKIQRLDFAW